MAIVEDSSSFKTVDLGDAVIVYADSALGNDVDIIGGAGADSLFTFDGAPIAFDMSASSKDIIGFISGANQKITLEGYNPYQGGRRATLHNF